MLKVSSSCPRQRQDRNNMPDNRGTTSCLGVISHTEIMSNTAPSPLIDHPYMLGNNQS